MFEAPIRIRIAKIVKDLKEKPLISPRIGTKFEFRTTENDGYNWISPSKIEYFLYLSINKNFRKHKNGKYQMMKLGSLRTLLLSASIQISAFWQKISCSLSRREESCKHKLSACLSARSKKRAFSRWLLLSIDHGNIVGPRIIGVGEYELRLGMESKIYDW